MEDRSMTEMIGDILLGASSEPEVNIGIKNESMIEMNWNISLCNSTSQIEYLKPPAHFSTVQVSNQKPIMRFNIRTSCFVTNTPLFS